MNWWALFWIYVVVSLIFMGRFAWVRYKQDQARLLEIHRRLDDLDPGVRALSDEEEFERRYLMQELEDLE